MEIPNGILLIGGLVIFYLAWTFAKHLDDFSYRIAELEKGREDIGDEE